MDSFYIFETVNNVEKSDFVDHWIYQVFDNATVSTFLLLLFGLLIYKYQKKIDRIEIQRKEVIDELNLLMVKIDQIEFILESVKVFYDNEKKVDGEDIKNFIEEETDELIPILKGILFHLMKCKRLIKLYFNEKTFNEYQKFIEEFISWHNTISPIIEEKNSNISLIREKSNKKIAKLNNFFENIVNNINENKYKSIFQKIKNFLSKK